MILGVHVPVALGHEAALARASALGCAAAQMLPFRRHHVPDQKTLSAFRAAREASDVRVLLIHSRFVPSLASSDEVRRGRSAAHLARELSLCEDLSGDAYVLHAGAYSPDADLAKGIDLFADSIRRALDASGFSGTILLENVPGGGRRMGGTLEEMARLYEAVRPLSARFAFCLDTAHAWAAGYDLSSAEAALKFLSRAHRVLGGTIGAFHLNDSRALLGSHLESHWHWGQGRLGLEGLKVLLERSEFAQTPGILEPPPEPGADAQNVAFVRRLLSA